MKTPSMEFNRKGAIVKPLKVYPINGKYILAVYKGSLSDYDLLIKYRQKDGSTNNGWSRIRTPKHIHWAVDILIKMNIENGKTKDLLTFLIEYWDKKVSPIKSKKEQDNLLKNKILTEVINDATQYKKT